MECKKCQSKIVLHAFSNGKCEICKTEVVTVNTPCDKLCEKCSNEHKKCKSCGLDIN